MLTGFDKLGYLWFIISIRNFDSESKCMFMDLFLLAEIPRNIDIYQLFLHEEPRVTL